VSATAQRWVIISNCQAYGVARSIRCLARDVVECDHLDVWRFKELVEEGATDFRARYDLALVAPEVRMRVDYADRDMPEQLYVPSVTFSAYHPDACYVTADGNILEGLVGPYHSMIALAAYKEGLSAAQAARWFNGGLYERAGYFSLWEPQRDSLLAAFPPEWNMGSAFLRWSRGRSFMHTINHPTIEMLFEMSRGILLGLGRPTFAGAMPPPEYLAELSWPIYPEIGERLGLPGSYLFKPKWGDRPFELLPFLEQSLAAFAGWDRSLLRVQREVQPRLQAIRQIMREGL
jgi:hypothetical protein